jgi:hypothetical protein
VIELFDRRGAPGQNFCEPGSGSDSPRQYCHLTTATVDDLLDQRPRRSQGCRGGPERPGSRFGGLGT